MKIIINFYEISHSKYYFNKCLIKLREKEKKYKLWRYTITNKLEKYVSKCNKRNKINKYYCILFE